MQSPLDRLSLAFHLLAVFSLGIMAGFFGTYSANIAPALLELEGPLYVHVQAAFNRHVRHALFFGFFFGPALWCALCTAAGWSSWGRPWWWLVAAAGVAHALGIVWFTRVVNLPLNYQTEAWAAAGAPAADWSVVRAAWNQANDWRAGLCAVLFAVALASLVWRLAPAAPPQVRR